MTSVFSCIDCVLVAFAVIGSLRIDDFRTTPPLGHVIVLRCRPVEI